MKVNVYNWFSRREKRPWFGFGGILFLLALLSFFLSILFCTDYKLSG